MTKKKILIIIIVLIAAIVGTSVGINSYRNRLIPNKQRMAEILADIYVADAVAQQKVQRLVSGNNIVERVYKTVLDHYEISRFEFDSIISWYSVHPKEYSEVYFEVIAILTEREARMSRAIKMRDSISSLIDKMRDSLTVDYWKYGKTTTLRLPRTDKDTFPKDLTFEVDVDSLRGGVVTLEMGYSFQSKDKSTDESFMQLVACYNDSTADTTKYRISRRISRQTATIRYNVRDTLSAVKLKATLLTSKQLDITAAMLSGIKFQYVPYEVTDSVTFDEIKLPPVFSF